VSDTYSSDGADRTPVDGADGCIQQNEL